MLYAIGVIVAVSAFIGIAAFWRVRTGVFCDRCLRPAHKCSCIEDGFAEPPCAIKEAVERAKIRIPLDS